MYQSVFKKAFCKLCVIICGQFHPDEGVVTGCDNRIRTKYTAKRGVQIAEMIFKHAPETKTKHTKSGGKKHDNFKMFRNNLCLQ